MSKAALPDKGKAEAQRRAQRLREAIALQEIEGNPLSGDEIAMLEKFEEDGLSDEEMIAQIILQHRQPE